VLPDSYDAIDPFVDAEFDLPEFHVFDGPTAIVDTVVENVTPETADDVAVIMDSGGEYPALVESAFEAADIPFYGGRDSPTTRPSARTSDCCGRAHSDCGHASAMFDRSSPISVAHPPSSTTRSSSTNSITRSSVRCRSSVALSRDYTFGETVSTFEDWSGQTLDAFHEELRELGLHDERVTNGSVDDLEFYLQSFDVPVERDDSGVLLADATAAAYVDRPVVFYLGMDVDWTPCSRPSVDRRRLEGRAVPSTVPDSPPERSRSVLSGTRDERRPARHTVSLLPRPPRRRLRDDRRPAAHPHTRLSSDGDAGFEKEDVDVAPSEIDVVSQSSLNTFVNCPRDYYFDRIVDNPDRDYFQKGNLFHDYAEFYVNHPDVVEGTDRSELVDLMLAEMRPYVPDVEREPLETEFEIGLDTIEQFVVADPPTNREYSQYERQEGTTSSPTTSRSRSTRPSPNAGSRVPNSAARAKST